MPTNIDQRQIDQNRSQLTPVRDLRGTWEGTLADIHTQPRCIWAIPYLMRLVINDQTDTIITGTVSYELQKSTVLHTNTNCIGSNGSNVWTPPIPFRADISGSRFTNFDSGTWGSLSGSFTTDTITINPGQARAVGGVTDQISKPINLLRQQ